MNLLRWELKIGMVKGLVFGVRPYEFEGEETYEVDHVVYVGIFQIILTMSDGEIAFTSFQKATRQININRGFIAKNGGSIHPTQKPVKL